MKTFAMEARAIKLAISNRLHSLYPQFQFRVLVYRTGPELVAEVKYTDFLPKEVILHDLESLHTHADVVDVTRHMSHKAMLTILTDLYNKTPQSRISTTQDGVSRSYCSIQSYVMQKFSTTNYAKKTDE